MNQILHIKISPLTYESTLRKITTWISNNKKHYICVAAIHLIMECQSDPRLLKGVNKASLVASDGMPLVWILKKRGFKNIERIYGPDLMDKICKLAEKKNYKIFILGGAKGQSREVQHKLNEKYPKLLIAGNYDTPEKTLNKSENDEINTEINKSKAQIVFNGMGCPYQELWMIENRRKLRANILIGVGAAFNFLTGREKQAPKFIQRLGLEWLFRFLHDPFGKWDRYIIMNFKFIYMLLKGKKSNINY